MIMKGSVIPDETIIVLNSRIKLAIELNGRHCVVTGGTFKTLRKDVEWLK